jgi:hypothetical protein
MKKTVSLNPEKNQKKSDINQLLFFYPMPVKNRCPFENTKASNCLKTLS